MIYLTYILINILSINLIFSLNIFNFNTLSKFKKINIKYFFNCRRLFFIKIIKKLKAKNILKKYKDKISKASNNILSNILFNILEKRKEY